jgi:hypothetical protein|nr:MAG TPA: hypothetical protein [Caudoviricetes sp.]
MSELYEKLSVLSNRIKTLKDSITTEEATKQSFILPFFQALGFDVFNPLEFCPEYVADVGIKKGEKVDYAIFQDSKPFIIIEAKPHFDNLSKHESQLYRYFSVTECRFAILTNGVVYKFFADLDEPNKMDKLPFFTLDLLNLTDNSVNYLEKFRKENLDVDSIMNTASELKYLNLAKEAFRKLIEGDSEDLERLIISDFYSGAKTQIVIEKFKPIVKRAITSYLNEKMATRFKETLNQTDEENDTSEETEESKIVTTMEELNAFAVVKSIVRKSISAKRLVYKDTESYFGVLVDNNTRKWLCRFILGKKNNYLILPTEDKKELKLSISTVDDIYNYDQQIIEVVNRYI